MAKKFNQRQIDRMLSGDAPLIKSRKVRTKEIDHGFKSILKELKKLEYKPYVKVGFPDGNPQTEKEKIVVVRDSEGDVSAIYEDGELTVLDVAIFHEFGTENMPERSFVRASHDENLASMKKFTKQLYEKIIVGKMSVERALALLGLKAENNIKNYLESGKVSPDSWRAIQQGGKTLIDSAQMINSITSIRVMKP